MLYSRNGTSSRESVFQWDKLWRLREGLAPSCSRLPPQGPGQRTGVLGGGGAQGFHAQLPPARVFTRNMKVTCQSRSVFFNSTMP